MSYLTFGANVQTVVIVNLDTTSKFTQAVSATTSPVCPPTARRLTL